MSGSDSDDGGIPMQQSTTPVVPGAKRGRPASTRNQGVGKVTPRGNLSGSDVIAINARLDGIDGKLDRIDRQVREIMNIVKSVQQLLPRVVSSGAQGHFSSTGADKPPTGFFMP